MLSETEKRALYRHRVLKAATIEFGGSAIDCTLRNLSATGAALDVPSPVGIPDNFDLVVSSDALRFACRVVWRKAERIGVRIRLADAARKPVASSIAAAKDIEGLSQNRTIRKFRRHATDP